MTTQTSMQLALQKIKEMETQMRELSLELASATVDRLTPGAGDIQLTLHQAGQRMQEAAMLLTLTQGGARPLHRNLQALHGTIVSTATAARVTLDQDINYDGLTAEQIDAISQTLALAESGYQNFRVLSTLALLHMSTALDLHDQAKAGKAAEPQEGAPA